MSNSPVEYDAGAAEHNAGARTPEVDGTDEHSAGAMDYDALADTPGDSRMPRGPAALRYRPEGELPPGSEVPDFRYDTLEMGLRFYKTRALFVGNLTPPLDAQRFQQHIKALAAPATIDRCWLARQRTHGLVLVSDETGAEDVREKLHGSHYPEDDHASLALFCDFVPAKRVKEWAFQEDRGPKDGKWCVEYVDGPDDGGSPQRYANHKLLSAGRVPEFHPRAGGGGGGRGGRGGDRWGGDRSRGGGRGRGDRGYGDRGYGGDRGDRGYGDRGDRGYGDRNDRGYGDRNDRGYGNRGYGDRYDRPRLRLPRRD